MPLFKAAAHLRARGGGRARPDTWAPRLAARTHSHRGSSDWGWRCLRRCGCERPDDCCPAWLRTARLAGLCGCQDWRNKPAALRHRWACDPATHRRGGGTHL
jgi:hypothetical protein